MWGAPAQGGWGWGWGGGVGWGWVGDAPAAHAEFAVSASGKHRHTPLGGKGLTLRKDEAWISVFGMQPPKRSLISAISACARVAVGVAGEMVVAAVAAVAAADGCPAPPVIAAPEDAAADARTVRRLFERLSAALFLGTTTSPAARDCCRLLDTNISSREDLDHPSDVWSSMPWRHRHRRCGSRRGAEGGPMMIDAKSELTCGGAVVYLSSLGASAMHCRFS